MYPLGSVPLFPAPPCDNNIFYYSYLHDGTSQCGKFGLNLMINIQEVERGKIKRDGRR